MLPWAGLLRIVPAACEYEQGRIGRRGIQSVDVALESGGLALEASKASLTNGLVVIPLVDMRV